MLQWWSRRKSWVWDGETQFGTDLQFDQLSPNFSSKRSSNKIAFSLQRKSLYLGWPNGNLKTPWISIHHENVAIPISTIWKTDLSPTLSCNPSEDLSPPQLCKSKGVFVPKWLICRNPWLHKSTWEDIQTTNDEQWTSLLYLFFSHPIKWFLLEDSSLILLLHFIILLRILINLIAF